MDNVRVQEEELRAAVALGARDGVGGAAGRVRAGFGEEDVFEGAELWGFGKVSLFWKKNGAKREGRLGRVAEENGERAY